MVSIPRAVLFDFSGTLFRFEARDEWFADLRSDDGSVLRIEEKAELVRRMTQPVGLPSVIDDDDRIAWEQRDLDVDQHRRAYLAVLRASGLSAPGDAESLYARVLDPQSWVPYPDTARVLRALAAAQVPMGIVSNIAFDLRAVFARNHLDDTIGAWALSYEVGAIKPNPRIFQAALEVLGVEPDDALMVGDSEEADGGARQLGAAFELVHDAPVSSRPDALVHAVAAHGLPVGR